MKTTSSKKGCLISQQSNVRKQTLFRCLESSSQSFGEKSSFPSTPTTGSFPAPEGRQQFGKRQDWEEKRSRGEVSGGWTEEGEIKCWLPDMTQFMQKKIKVEGVGIKRVRDLKMNDFLRLVPPNEVNWQLDRFFHFHFYWVIAVIISIFHCTAMFLQPFLDSKF